MYYIFLISEQPSILSIMESDYFYLIVLSFSVSIRHSLLSKRKEKEREEEDHRSF